MIPWHRLRASRRAGLRVETLEDRLVPDGTPLGSLSTLSTSTLLRAPSTTLTTGVVRPISTTISPILSPTLLLNSPPVGARDAYQVQQDTTLTVARPGVLANDTDRENDPLAAVLVDQPLHGILMLRADGSFTYTPQSGFGGTDTFAYSASDGRLLSSPTLVQLTVTTTPPNNLPLAENNAYTATLNTSIAGTQFSVAAPGVLGNDTDIEGDALSAQLRTGPGHGTLTLNADGSFVYRPEQGFSGTDSFTYAARDSSGSSNEATVSITVNTDSSRAILLNDVFAVPTGRTLVVSGLGVLANDTLPAGATPLINTTASLQIPPSNGVVTFNADGTFILNPPPGFIGPIQFTYSLSAPGAPPATAIVQINVLPPPEPPSPEVLDEQVREQASSSTPTDQPAEPDLILPGPALRPGLSPALGVFDPTSGNWYLRTAVAPGAPDVKPFAYGAPEWVPLLGDWDGNGTITIGVFDPFTATFYLRNSNDPGAPDFTPFAFGVPGWLPVVGDWDGDGLDTIGVFDPATATFYLRNSNSPGAPDFAPFAYGVPGWLPVVGDWDGNGTTTVGVFDPSTATFYLRNSNDPGAPAVAPFAFGGSAWRPVVGDWDGDGSTTVGVFDPSGRWYLRNHNSPGMPHAGRFAYGVGSWAPVAGQWQEVQLQALLAEEEGPGGATDLARSDLAGVADAARVRLGGKGSVLTPVGVADLPGRQLGLYDGSAVWLDRDAAGHGWFVDSTPLQDEEFAGGKALGEAAGRMDLLTVVMHELSHGLGLDDLDPGAHPDALMAATLTPGTRRTG
ncbi:MAG: Ig-like domain-containing protein [Gemmataceae bacterium]|nr:Ig-like domain-containing protein [Gemmataceae bacterium]